MVKGKWRLRLKTKDLLNWERLSKYVDTSFKNSLSELLFWKFLFQMDLNALQGEVDVDAIDATIVISWKDNKVISEVWKKMGDVSDQKELPLDDVTLAMTDPIFSKRGVEDIKKRLQDGFADYFKKYKAKMERLKVETIYQLDNSLIIEVSNIVDAVLDEGYFEHLQLNFDFIPEGQGVKIKYVIQGKYGAGLFWAPHNSRYHDMLPEYEKEMSRFLLIMKNKMGELLK
jgi:hypothetical protein